VVTGDASSATGADLERWLDIHCGTDIQVHSVKGSIGVRVDGADNLNIDNLRISDILSTTQLGSMRCGEYDAPTIAGEEVYIQPGFNGHRAHGLTTVYTSGTIKDLYIDSIASHYGNAYGLRVFDGCKITLAGNINVNQINAGTIFEPNQIDMAFMIKSLTNPLPQACGVYLYSDQDNIDYDDTTTSIISNDVVGYRECQETVIRSDEDNNVFTSQLIGQCNNCIVKDYVVGNVLTLKYDQNQTQTKKKKSSSSSSIIIFILSTFAIIALYVVFKYKYYSSSTFKQISTAYSDENTPLLK